LRYEKEKEEEITIGAKIRKSERRDRREQSDEEASSSFTGRDGKVTKYK
jgi:hypothetical protein